MVLVTAVGVLASTIIVWLVTPRRPITAARPKASTGATINRMNVARPMFPRSRVTEVRASCMPRMSSIIGTEALPTMSTALNSGAGIVAPVRLTAPASSTA